MNKGNESAFPLMETQRVYNADSDSMENLPYTNGGLTKRELFAAIAMQGILSNEARREAVCANDGTVAAEALKNSDALLAQLNKEPERE